MEVLGCKKGYVSVATMFDSTSNLMQENDIVVKDEKQLRTILNSGKYQKVIADPLVEQLLTEKTKSEGIKFFALPHVAVSSKICWDKPVRFLSEEFSQFVRNVIKQ